MSSTVHQLTRSSSTKSNNMIAKVCLFLSALAAAQASGLLAAGHLGSISSQRTAINHVAPVATIAAAPMAIGHGLGLGAVNYGMGLGHGGLGLGAINYGMGLGHGGLGLGAANLGHGGLLAGNLRADGITGHGILGARYGNAIAHNAVVGVGHGLIGGARYGGVYGLGLGGHGLGLAGHGLGLGKAIW